MKKFGRNRFAKQLEEYEDDIRNKYRKISDREIDNAIKNSCAEIAANDRRHDQDIKELNDRHTTDRRNIRDNITKEFSAKLADRNTKINMLQKKSEEYKEFYEHVKLREYNLFETWKNSEIGIEQAMKKIEQGYSNFMKVRAEIDTHNRKQIALDIKNQKLVEDL